MPIQSGDIAIVGAGAAGLMTAIWAGRTAQAAGASARILLLDGRPAIGAKILMSGGTRCNLTNRAVTPADFHGGPSHFVRHVLEAFTPQATVRLFEAIGVRVILEPSGKYFPSTHSARTVLAALTRETQRLGVELRQGTRITAVTKTGDRFHVNGEGGAPVASAQAVVLTTGGLSHPTTGSDGTGHRIAAQFGHTVTRTFPALTPLLTDDAGWRRLSGVSLPVALACVSRGKTIAECRDALLFTHNGFSGPAALNISRYVAGAPPGERPQIVANFLPKEDAQSLQAAWQSARRRHPTKLVKHLLAEQFALPLRFAETCVSKAGLNAAAPVAQCSSRRLWQVLLRYPLEVTGVIGYRKAEVTAGGVELTEVRVATMESRLVSGLYFAGEILDVDGRIGGFNFQWAWSTGAIAGRSAARQVMS